MRVAWDETLPAPDTDGRTLPRVLSRDEALARGVTRHVIDRRLRSGQWRRVLPRTYLTVDTMLWTDRLAAALAFAGPRAVLSGAAALRTDGLRSVAVPAETLVLVPRTSRLRSVEWVRVRPTNRLPEPARRPGPRRADVSRAVADHALRLRHLDDVRAVIAEAVGRCLCTTSELACELDAGPRNGSALLRLALDEVAAGAASAPEAQAARILRGAGVAPFEQNVRIERANGRWYVADFLWRSRRAILEMDSREYHFAPREWRATMDRHLALSTLGYSVVHRPPSALRDPRRFAADVIAWLDGLAIVDQQPANLRYRRLSGS